MQKLAGASKVCSGFPERIKVGDKEREVEFQGVLGVLGGCVCLGATQCTMYWLVLKCTEVAESEKTCSIRFLMLLKG